jgi:hypothetical protein
LQAEFGAPLFSLKGQFIKDSADKPHGHDWFSKFVESKRRSGTQSLRREQGEIFIHYAGISMPFGVPFDLFHCLLRPHHITHQRVNMDIARNALSEILNRQVKGNIATVVIPRTNSASNDTHAR